MDFCAMHMVKVVLYCVKDKVTETQKVAILQW